MVKIREHFSCASHCNKCFTWIYASNKKLYEVTVITFPVFK